METTHQNATQETRTGARHQGRAETPTRRTTACAAVSGVVVVDLTREVL
jgi:hypothetical protein